MTFALLATLLFFACGHSLLAPREWNSATRVGNTRDAMSAIEEGSIQRRVALVGLALFGAGLWYRKRNGARPEGLRGPIGWTILAFVIWAGLSVFWSEEPGLTVRRVLGLVTLGVGAAGVSRRLSVDELARFMVVAITAYLVVGVSVEMALGSFTPFAGDYRFAGTLHPNHQAVNCALLALAIMHLVRSGTPRRAALVSLAATAVVFLLLAKSRTALGAGVVAGVVYWGLIASRPARLAALGAGVVAGAVLVALFAGGIVRGPLEALSLGRADSDVTTLTGRISLWEQLAPYVAARPIQGYGFQTFWTPARVQDFTTEDFWTVAESHSTYVEQLLGLGTVGLALYVSLLGAALLVATGRALVSGDANHAFIASILVFAACEGLTESAILSPTFATFLTVVAVVSVARRGVRVTTARVHQTRTAARYRRLARLSADPVRG